MSKFNIGDILQKADDLQVIPFLADLINMTRDIKPLLDNISNTLEENVQKFPTATKKLSKVTEATEIATTEIMNVVDGLFNKIEKIQKKLIINKSAISETITFLNKIMVVEEFKDEAASIINS